MPEEKLTQKEEREEDRKNRLLVIQEAIKRSPRYRFLYSAIVKAEKDFEKNPSEKNGALVTDLSVKILREFHITTLINPDKKTPPTEDELYYLEREFLRDALSFNHSVYAHACDCPDRRIEFRIAIDMKKSATAICNELDDLIKNIKARRRKNGFDGLDIIDGKKRNQIYHLKDFEWYDFVNDFRKKHGEISLKKIAEALLENPNLAPHLKLSGSRPLDVLENTYNRAKWCVEGGFRTFM